MNLLAEIYIIIGIFTCSYARAMKDEPMMLGSYIVLLFCWPFYWHTEIKI